MDTDAIRKKLIQQLQEMEAIADFFQDRATVFKKTCSDAAKSLAGVSTPAVRKGSAAKVARALAKHQARKLSKLKNPVDLR